MIFIRGPFRAHILALFAPGSERTELSGCIQPPLPRCLLPRGFLLPQFLAIRDVHQNGASPFCYYRATGRALRQHVSALLHDEIVRLGAAKLPRVQLERVADELDEIGDRFFDSDGALRRDR